MIMTLIYPNIVPENNLRLPDALTVKHGPARLLSRFVLEGDVAARQMGLRLRLRHDFGELLYLNEREVAHGNWFKLVNMYNPAYCDLSPENSYWISGENEHGEIVLTQAGRIYYWPETSLAEEARSMFYADHDEGQLCTVTAPAARRIGGVVFCAGSHWIRPDFRGRPLSHLLARLGRGYALARCRVGGRLRPSHNRNAAGRCSPRSCKIATPIVHSFCPAGSSLFRRWRANGICRPANWCARLR